MLNEEQHNRSYSLADIEQYLQGRLSPAEMHALEKAALQDPFLADAIEGYRESDLLSAKSHLQDIRQQLIRQQEGRVVAGHFGYRRWWRVAAIVLVVLGMGGAGWYLLRQAPGNEIVQQKAAPLPPLARTTDTNLSAPVAKPVMPATTATTQSVLPKVSSKVSPSITPPSPVPVAAMAPVSEPDSNYAAMTVSLFKPADTNRARIAPVLEREMQDRYLPIKQNNIRLRGLAAAKKETVLPPAAAAKDTNDSMSLSETVIVGYAAGSNKKDFPANNTEPVPEGGWDPFYTYLKNKFNNNLHGEIEAELVLNDTGIVSKVTIIRSFNRSLNPFNRRTNAKIKLALIEGPAWLVAGQKAKGNYRISLEL